MARLNEKVPLETVVKWAAREVLRYKEENGDLKNRLHNKKLKIKQLEQKIKEQTKSLHKLNEKVIELNKQIASSHSAIDILTTS